MQDKRLCSQKGNGRCGLEESRLELYEDNNLTGICLCFKKKTRKNRKKKS